MATDERSRLELADAAKRVLGYDAGTTLMELLPPVGWADVATRHDVEQQLGALRSEMRQEISALRTELVVLELRLEARVERGFRQVLVTVTSLMVTGFVATIVANLTA
jgi:hypothetical protein